MRQLHVSRFTFYVFITKTNNLYIRNTVMQNERPNILYIFADQLRAKSLSIYDETIIDTPNIDRLAKEGMTFDNMISTCPVCTPYRSMLLTGRHPQTTGHIINFMRTRHDEIGFGDVFSHAGYKTGWIGKWHLHTGSFPVIEGPDYVPEGRDRLGFEHWRGYNFHTDYMEGAVNLDDWRVEHWEGYETDALAKYSMEFMDSCGDDPFVCFLSPHQPHCTQGMNAPDKYYEKLPDTLPWPETVPESRMEEYQEYYRHYLAMTLAIDDMLGQMLDYLDRKGLTENTITIFTSDHGTQACAHDWGMFQKKLAYEESIKIPMIIRWPGTFEPGSRCETLTAPVDLMPTLCGLTDTSIPRSVEGCNLSDSWLEKENAFEQDAVFMMNFTKAHDYLVNGEEWRGVRTLTHTYVKWLHGLEELYENTADPLQQNNLIGKQEAAEIKNDLKEQLAGLMEKRNDTMIPCTDYADWFDEQRRVVRNVYGPMGDPERTPDWSLLA